MFSFTHRLPAALGLPSAAAAAGTAVLLCRCTPCVGYPGVQPRKDRLQEGHAMAAMHCRQSPASPWAHHLALPPPPEWQPCQPAACACTIGGCHSGTAHLESIPLGGVILLQRPQRLGPLGLVALGVVCQLLLIPSANGPGHARGVKVHATRMQGGDGHMGKQAPASVRPKNGSRSPADAAAGYFMEWRTHLRCRSVSAK